VVPGNHDVGDKPDGVAGVPSADPDKHAVFAAHWGPAFHAFDHKGVRFVWLDAPVLNSGTTFEAEQRAWLEADLAAAHDRGQRIFLAMHYPPFLCEPDELEHYDNVAEPARSWVLGLLERYSVEALFCGHVHHFFWNRTGQTDHYLLPATSFMRPEYAELVPVAPTDDEFGRNDVLKLGFALVHVADEGHRYEPVRTHVRQGQPPEPDVALSAGRDGPPRNPLGISLRQNLGVTHDIPLGNLDAFRRKAARNDLFIQAMWELGIERVRVPARDLVEPRARARLLALAARGTQLHVFSTESETTELQALLLQEAGSIATWEIVSQQGLLPPSVQAGEALARGIDLCLSVVGGKPAGETAYFSHFPRQGFTADDPRLASIAQAPVQWVMGRIGTDASVTEQVDQLLSATQGVGLTALVEFPRVDEGVAATDDAQVTERVLEAFEVAQRYPQVQLFLDTFVDHDRGYYPRHGLLDRGGHPRDAFYALKRAVYRAS
jgi:hypothetical protein